MNGVVSSTRGLLSNATTALTTTAAKRILKNIVALSVAQLASYLLPLVVLPYTALTLGPTHFGVVALIQAVVQYSTLITNYGFSYSATRMAAVSHDDKATLAEIVVHVWTAKLLLMFLCLVASLSAFAVFPSLHPMIGPYLASFLTVVGNVLYLDWFFQAIQEMRWITLINLVPKLLLTPLIFVIVRQPSDYVWLILIQSATFLTSGIMGAALVRKRLGIRLPAPTLSGVIAQLKDGWRTFMATVSISVYTSTNIVLLGLLSNVSVVGYYSAGQKLVAGALCLWTPFSQSLYPHFCKSFHEDANHAAAQLKKLLVIFAALTAFASAMVCTAAPYFVPRYLGPMFASSIGIVQVLIFSLCAIATNNLLGIQGMLAAGLHGDFLRVVTIAAAANLVLAPIAILAWGGIGLAMTTVAVETLICVLEYRLLRRRALLL